MFWPVKMCKARIYCVKSSLTGAIDALHDYGAVQIKEVNLHDFTKPESQTDFGLAQRRLRLEAITGALQERKGKIGEKEAIELAKSKKLKSAEERAVKISAEIGRINSETDVLKEDVKRLKMFEKFEIDFSKLKTATTQTIAGIVQKANQALFAKAISEEGLGYAQKSISHGANIVLVYLENGNEKAIENLARSGFERMQIPQIQATPARQILAIERKIAALEKEKSKLFAEVGKIGEKNYIRFAAVKELIEISDHKSRAARNAAASAHTAILEAYLPENRFIELEDALEQKLGRGAAIEKVSSRELEKMHEHTPTLLDNPKFLQPFEFIVKYLSIPKSNEIDPTIIFTLFFPLFYGMIVGDVIYGVISFLLARWIFGKVTQESILKPVSAIWMYGSIPSILFGVLFDEYGGFSHHELLEKIGIGGILVYQGFERMHYTQMILGASIVLGVLTMAAGFLLGALNSLRHGHKDHAMVKAAWFCIVTFGTILVATAMFGAFPESFLIPSAAIAGLCALFVILKEGIAGAIEIPGVIGNILSFARLIAVGLVGTVIASILNEMAFPGLDKGILLIVIVPLYIGGHLFNAFLAMFEALVQGARLNFVEFYPKFFEGGGEEFAPFRLETRYLKTKEVR